MQVKLNSLPRYKLETTVRVGQMSRHDCGLTTLNYYLSIHTVMNSLQQRPKYGRIDEQMVWHFAY